MESKLWSPMDEFPLCEDVIIVDRDGNYQLCYEPTKSYFEELINDGFHKWCYLADLVQAAYEM